MKIPSERVSRKKRRNRRTCRRKLQEFLATGQVKKTWLDEVEAEAGLECSSQADSIDVLDFWSTVLRGLDFGSHEENCFVWERGS